MESSIVGLLPESTLNVSTVNRLAIATEILANLLSNDNIIDLYSSEDQRINTCKWALSWADTLINLDKSKT